MSFAVGDVVHHNGEDGRFVVKKIRDDGDLDTFGGLGWHPDPSFRNKHYAAAFRTFRPTECRLAAVKRKLRKDDQTS